jgi:hypothetical protein
MHSATQSLCMPASARGQVSGDTAQVPLDDSRVLEPEAATQYPVALVHGYAYALW